MTSAPEPTEPRMVTSPSGKMIDWPGAHGRVDREARTSGGHRRRQGPACRGAAMRRAGAVRGLAGSPATAPPARSSPASRPPRMAGGMPGPSMRGRGALDAHDPHAAGRRALRESGELRPRSSVESVDVEHDRPAEEEAGRSRGEIVEARQPVREGQLRRKHQREEGAASQAHGFGGRGSVGHRRNSGCRDPIAPSLLRR